MAAQGWSAHAMPVHAFVRDLLITGYGRYGSRITVVDLTELIYSMPNLGRFRYPAATKNTLLRLLTSLVAGNLQAQSQPA